MRLLPLSTTQLHLVLAGMAALTGTSRGVALGVLITLIMACRHAVRRQLSLQPPDHRAAWQYAGVPQTAATGRACRELPRSAGAGQSALPPLHPPAR